jgi:hypothetical protein
MSILLSPYNYIITHSFQKEGLALTAVVVVAPGMAVL